MTYEVLEKMTERYLSCGLRLSSFAWQGGEPTLMGLDFYKKVVEFQNQYKKNGCEVTNSFQTNAILLNDEWCDFLAKNNFLVGISIDGPKEYHDHYRLDHAGGGTFDKVMRAIECCKKHEVDFNLLVLLNDHNIEAPDELFDFLVGTGTRYLQFIPCVEADPVTGEMSGFAVSPKKYGDFMCRIFDRWYEYGPDKLSIRDFDSIISYCVNGAHTICTFTKQCADYIVMEHNGDAFCCDFFVEPKWRIGNIFETPIGELANSEKKKEFNRLKGGLCSKCLICRYLDACRGGCVKDRLAGGRVDHTQSSYLCDGYKQFFTHSLGKFMELGARLRAGEFERK